jgi:hypothetical protein
MTVVHRDHGRCSSIAITSLVRSAETVRPTRPSPGLLGESRAGSVLPVLGLSLDLELLQGLQIALGVSGELGDLIE